MTDLGDASPHPGGSTASCVPHSRGLLAVGLFGQSLEAVFGSKFVHVVPLRYSVHVSRGCFSRVSSRGGN